MEIYLLEFKKKKPESIEEIIKELCSYNFTDYNQDCYKSVETYSDKECTKIECYDNKFRSADALVEIVQTYFPNATEKEIFTSLINTKLIGRNGKQYHLCLYYCETIYKPVFYFNKQSYLSLNASAEDYSSNDDYYDNQSKYENWKEIINMTDINADSLYKHLEGL